MNYHHTQTAPLYLLVLFPAIAMLIAAWLVPEQISKFILLGVGSCLLLLSFCFQSLTLSDEGEYLRVCFGPIPLFRRRVGYSHIKSVEPARSTLLDGWGIHLSPSGGWTWNLWGVDCVDIHFKQGGKLRLGSDDVEALTAFLQIRIAEVEKQGRHS